MLTLSTCEINNDDGKGRQGSEWEEGFRRGSEIFCWSSLLRGSRQDDDHDSDVDGGDDDCDGDCH